MRMCLGAPLAAILVGLLGVVQSASASHFGAAGYDGCARSRAAMPSPASRPVSSSAHLLQAGLRHGPGEALAHLLPDGAGNRHEAGLQDLLPRRVQDLLQELSPRPATKTSPGSLPDGRSPRPAGKDCEYTVCKPCYKTCYKEVCETVCKPVLRDLLQGVPLHDLQEGAGVLREGSLLHRLQAGVRSRTATSPATRSASTICEQHCRECCETVCKPVCETCYKDVCCDDLQAGLRDLHTRRSAARPTRNCVETCYKDVCKTICKPVCTTKTVAEEVRRMGDRAVLRPGHEPPALRARVRRVLLRSLHLPDAPEARPLEALLGAVPRRDPLPQGLARAHRLRDGALHDLREGMHPREGAVHGLQEGAAHGRQEGSVHRHAGWCRKPR